MNKIDQLPRSIFRCFLPLFCLLASLASGQDTIVFENKYPFVVDIVEESQDRLLYRRLDLRKSPTYLLDKRYITAIGYQDPGRAATIFRERPTIADRNLDVWVTTMQPHEETRGVLHRFSDTTLVARKKGAKTSVANTGLYPEVVYVFPFQNIDEIKVRPRNRIGKYAFWGTLAGFVAGATVGLWIFEDEPPCDPGSIDGQICDDSLFSPRTRQEKAVLLGFGSGGAGLLTGAILGSVKVSIPIRGRRDSFNNAQPTLLRIGR